MDNSHFAPRILLSMGLLLPLASTQAHHGNRDEDSQIPQRTVPDTSAIDIPGVLFAHDAREALCGRREHSLRHPFLERSTDTGTDQELPGCEPGDTLEFLVVSQDTAWYASTARVAPMFHGRTIQLLVDGSPATESVSIPDERRSVWRDLRLPAVKIPAGRHRMGIVFPEGGVKFRFLTLAYAAPGVPTALRAPQAWWPLNLGWTSGGNTASFLVLRRLHSVYDTAGTTSDTTFVDRPGYDSAHFVYLVQYVVVARNGSSTIASDTLSVSVLPAGASLAPVGRLWGSWTPGGFLLQWDAVPGALGYGIQGGLGTILPGGYGGGTDTTFFLDPLAVPGVIYRVFPYGDEHYYTAPLVGATALVPPRP